MTQTVLVWKWRDGEANEIRFATADAAETEQRRIVESDEHRDLEYCVTLPSDL